MPFPKWHNKDPPLPICTYVNPPYCHWPTRKIKARCVTCQCRNTRTPNCNATDTHGCISCATMGLPFVVDNWALPPHPNRPTGPVTYLSWSCCDQCSTPMTCDRGQPCQSCIDVGRDADCDRAISRRGLFFRPVPGTDMYGYWVNIGPHRGPNGPQDKSLPGTPFHQGTWRMGDNYHIEYVHELYKQNNWMIHWQGPMLLSQEAAEITRKQGPCYCGPPARCILPDPLSWPLPAWATGKSRRKQRATSTAADTNYPMGPQPGPSFVPGAPTPVLQPVPMSPSVYPDLPDNLVSPPEGPLQGWNPHRNFFIPLAGPSGLGNPAPFIPPNRSGLNGPESPFDSSPGFANPLSPFPEVPNLSEILSDTFRFTFPTGPRGLEIPRNGLGPTGQSLPDVASPDLILPFNTPDPLGEHLLPRFVTPIRSADIGLDAQDDSVHMDIDNVNSQLPPVKETSPTESEYNCLYSQWINLSPESLAALRDRSSGQPPVQPPIQELIQQPIQPSTLPQNDAFHGSTWATSMPVSKPMFDDMFKKRPAEPVKAMDPDLTAPSPKRMAISSESGASRSFQVAQPIMSVKLIPAPQPLGRVPNLPEDLIIQNEAVFRQHEQRAWSLWISTVKEREVTSGNVATQDWITYIKELVNPIGMKIRYTDELVPRPPSPGPLVTLYQGKDEAYISSDDPAYSTQGRSPLAYIPRDRIWTRGALAPVAGVCDSCNGAAYTHGTCESIDHSPRNDRTLVCKGCDLEARRNLFQLMVEFDVFRSLRRFACRRCTYPLLADLSRLNNSGHDIYYNAGLCKSGIDLQVATYARYPNEGNVVRGSVYDVMPLTGCSCAEKILDRRLCAAHRCQAFFDLLNRISGMLNYQRNKYGDNLCFACYRYPAQNPDDATNPIEAGKVWACLACSAIVIGVKPEALKNVDDMSGEYSDCLPGQEKSILLDN